MKQARKLRQMLAEGEPVVAGGCVEPLTGRLIQEAGFNSAYFSGYTAAATMLALPDTGYYTMTEMDGWIRNVTNAIDIPLIIDADNGYGTAINAQRTVRHFEKLGAAAMHIEDLLWPKYCAHIGGTRVGPMEEMALKIKACVAAREDPDFMIIARSEAPTGEIDGTIERLHAYVEAGADAVFLVGARSKKDLARIPKAFNVPCMVDITEGTYGPQDFTVEEAKDMGFKIVILALATFFAKIHAVRSVLKEIKEHGHTLNFRDRMANFKEMNEFLGVPRVWQLEKDYMTIDHK
ncbi:MAG: oxaloacetate decarboxylase [Chloroflexota bacterium]|nr:MAG: oxaloacetate decarboxylase [Chloroflexota bacterium]